MKANSKAGERSRQVTDLIFLLHEGTRQYPGAPLEFRVGSKLTRDGKAYVIEWRNDRFSSREMTPEEASADDAATLTRKVLR
jgi:hypothetical protein